MSSGDCRVRWKGCTGASSRAAGMGRAWAAAGQHTSGHGDGQGANCTLFDRMHQCHGSSEDRVCNGLHTAAPVCQRNRGGIGSSSAE